MGEGIRGKCWEWAEGNNVPLVFWAGVKILVIAKQK